MDKQIREQLKVLLLDFISNIDFDGKEKELNPDKCTYDHEKEKRVKIDRARKDPMSRKKIIFHGCCHSCSTPEKYGVGECLSCSYCIRYKGDNY